MSKITLQCAYCGQTFEREKGRYNEAVKKGWNQYCSQECQNESKKRRVVMPCGNPGCDNIVSRLKNQFKKSRSGLVFCSRSCAAIVTNKLFPRGEAKVKTCHYCGREFTGEGEKYCSRKCRDNAQKVSKEEILEQIRNFYKEKKRVPTKRECSHYSVARKRFGSWNKAVKTAGFEPNPVLFAKKHEARDGHICDSLSEKVIDDWLYGRDIEHKINVSYPESSGLTCDFVVDKYFIEFFGLEGEHDRYTELVEKKKALAKQYGLNLIELKPENLFPETCLKKKLGFLLD